MKISLPKLLLIITTTALLAWLAFGYFGIQALFTNKVVHEELPLYPTSTDAPSSTSSSTNTLAGTDTLAEPSPRLISSGEFGQGDSTYTIKGTARMINQDGQNILTFENFDVTNGPDLFVYLVTASSTENALVKDQVAAGQFIQLAALKGNRGNQSYILPTETNLSRYPVISIWCRRFSRNFGTTLLEIQKN